MITIDAVAAQLKTAVTISWAAQTDNLIRAEHFVYSQLHFNSWSRGSEIAC